MPVNVRGRPAGARPAGADVLRRRGAPAPGPAAAAPAAPPQTASPPPCARALRPPPPVKRTPRAAVACGFELGTGVRGTRTRVRGKHPSRLGKGGNTCGGGGQHAAGVVGPAYLDRPVVPAQLRARDSLIAARLCPSHVHVPRPKGPALSISPPPVLRLRGAADSRPETGPAQI